MLLLWTLAGAPALRAGVLSCDSGLTVGTLCFSGFSLTGPGTVGYTTQPNTTDDGIVIGFTGAEVLKGESLNFSFSYLVAPIDPSVIEAYNLLLAAMKHAGHSGGPGEPAYAFATAQLVSGPQVWSLDPTIEASPDGTDRLTTAGWYAPPAISSSLLITHSFSLFGGTKRDSPDDRINARVSSITDTFGVLEGAPPEVPEPVSMLLLGSGLAVLGIAGRRRILR